MVMLKWLNEYGIVQWKRRDKVPKAFLKCVSNGGKVRTIKLSDNKYRHKCTIGGKTYLGHIKTKKKKRK